MNRNRNRNRKINCTCHKPCWTSNCNKFHRNINVLLPSFTTISPFLQMVVAAELSISSLQRHVQCGPLTEFNKHKDMLNIYRWLIFLGIIVHLTLIFYVHYQSAYRILGISVIDVCIVAKSPTTVCCQDKIIDCQ